MALEEMEWGTEKKVQETEDKVTKSFQMQKPEWDSTPPLIWEPTRWGKAVHRALRERSVLGCKQVCELPCRWPFQDLLGFWKWLESHVKAASSSCGRGRGT